MRAIRRRAIVGIVRSGSGQVRRSVQVEGTVNYDLDLLIPDIGTVGKVGHIHSFNRIALINETCQNLIRVCDYPHIHIVAGRFPLCPTNLNQANVMTIPCPLSSIFHAG